MCYISIWHIFFFQSTLHCLSGIHVISSYIHLEMNTWPWCANPQFYFLSYRNNALIIKNKQKKLYKAIKYRVNITKLLLSCILTHLCPPGRTDTIHQCEWHVTVSKVILIMLFLTDWGASTTAYSRKYWCDTSTITLWFSFWSSLSSYGITWYRRPDRVLPTRTPDKTD